jgi:hypothetical protein
MKPSLAALAAVAVIASVAASPSPAAAPRLPPAAGAGETVFYGHVKSLARRGGRFEMQFDPALWLTGVAAQRAKLADTGSSDVPNDYYIVDESHRLLTFVVQPGARVTILTGGLGGTAITVAELAQIVSGKNPKHRKLSEPKAGFWIRVGFSYPNAVRSLDQQYQP